MHKIDEPLILADVNYFYKSNIRLTLLNDNANPNPYMSLEPSYFIGKLAYVKESKKIISIILIYKKKIHYLSLSVTNISF